MVAPTYLHRLVLRIAILLVVVALPLSVFAQVANEPDPCAITDYTKAIKLEIEIPGVTIDHDGGHYIKNLGCYIVGIYRYFAGVAGILTTVFVMYGGFRYIISFGNQSQIQSAKETISSALIGLLLVVSSYAILFFINPNLTRFNLDLGGTVPKLGEKTVWCTSESKIYENRPQVCGNFGIQANNELCVWSQGCPTGEVCVYAQTGNNGYKCVVPEQACTEFAKFEGDDGCKFVDEAFAAQGINNKGCTRKITTGIITQGQSGYGTFTDECVFDDLLVCSAFDPAAQFFAGTSLLQFGEDKSWRRINCEEGITTVSSEGCWDTVNNKPGSDVTHGLAIGWGIGTSITVAPCTDDVRIAQNAGQSICCVDVLGVSCSGILHSENIGQTGCNGDELELSGCEYTAPDGTTTNYTGQDYACTQAELDAGEVCCMQAALKVGN